MQLKGIEVSFGDGHLKIEELDISTEELHKVLERVWKLQLL